MITKNDWDAALDAWVIAERERLGGPPAPEEVVAYTRGELPEAEAARVRALLVYYPELTSLLLETEPATAHAASPKRHSLPRFMPLAASLVIALLTGGLLQSRWELARRDRESREPHVHQTRLELQPLRARGGPAEPPLFELPHGEEHYLLSLVLFEPLTDPEYRLELVDLSATEPEVVWTSPPVLPVDGTFELSLPRAFIGSGTYRIDVYGVDGERRHRLESFRVRAREMD